MHIPKLINVGKDKYINPEKIATFNDNGKWIEIGMSGLGMVRVEEKEYVDTVRDAVLNRIISSGADTVVEIQDADFTEIKNTLCKDFFYCTKCCKLDIYCVSNSKFDCYIYPEIEAKDLKTITKELEQKENFDMKSAECTGCPVFKYCSTVKYDQNYKSHNIPKCFRFIDDPGICDNCKIKEICTAKNSGECPVP